MGSQDKIRREHRARKACVYVRQSSPDQVLHHPESGRRQRELQKLVVSLGWPLSRVEVLEGDQGQTGQVAADREAFKHLVGEVSAGEVGIVVGLEVSRLARNNADWFPLIEICGLTGTLVADEEGVYDPNDPNDRLVLGLKGTLSEAELVRIKSRFDGARWSLARRGELRRKMPVGYVWDERGRVVLDPDERVRSAVRDLFARFIQLGSAAGVARSYARDGLLFPRRDHRGPWDGRVQWEPLSVRLTTLILHNPFYAGVYFYGERRAATVLDPATKGRKTVFRRRPREEWEVFLRDAHPGYIAYEQFLRNQERLRENCSRLRGAGVVRSGATLLQGIVHCGLCDRRMGVRYSGRQSKPYYLCGGRTKTGEGVYCMSVSAQRVDEWVAGTVLKAVQPLGIEAALDAISELERRWEDLRRQWQHRVEQAEYEAALARRRYEAVDPDNRLVASNLEREWEDKLRDVEEVRREHADRTAHLPLRISEEDRQRVVDLARDLPRLWRARSTKASDRTRIVRILIREVWLTQQDEPPRTRIQIHWQTGAVSEGFLPRILPVSRALRTPDHVVQRARELRDSSLSPKEVAERLNREGLRTGRGNAFTARKVTLLLRSRNGQSPQEDRGLRPPRDGATK